MFGLAWMIACAHTVMGSLLAGGQVFHALTAFGRTPDDARAVLVRMERRYRRLALAILLIEVALGFWLMDYVSLSRALLATTPYGTLMVAKVTGSILFTIYLIAAPSSHDPEDRGARWLGVVGGGIALGLVGASFAMRYI